MLLAEQIDPSRIIESQGLIGAVIALVSWLAKGWMQRIEDALRDSTKATEQLRERFDQHVLRDEAVLEELSAAIRKKPARRKAKPLAS